MDSVNVIKSEWCLCAFVVHSSKCLNDIIDVVRGNINRDKQTLLRGCSRWQDGLVFS